VSLEYEVRSDDSYSRTAPAAEVRRLLRERWGVEEAESTVLLYEADRCLVEIELGRREGAADPDRIQWVGLRVPAGARLESATRAIEIAMSVAQLLGWRLLDLQTDEHLEPSDLEPSPGWRDALAQLAREVGAEPVTALAKRLWLRGRRQSLRSIGEIAFGAALVAVVSGWLLGFRVEERPGLALGITAFVTALVVAADIVLDVLGEVHAAASARSGSARADATPDG
jgi:hypothetical protein